MSLKKQADIVDYSSYSDRMDRSIMDKLFFVDKVNSPDLIVDFGCASGTLLLHLDNWFSEATLMGYDRRKDSIKELKERTDSNNVEGTTQWDVIQSFNEKSEESVLVLSSVLHEVYHYSDTEQIDEFWNKVWNGGFDKIVIRDMVPSSSIDRRPPLETVRKVYSKFGGTKELEDFENEWGSIKGSYKQLIHFLLKYRYVEPNWKREVKENYLPFYQEDLLRKIPSEYSILFNHHYVLPFIKQKVREDFGIELNDPTHFKVILESI